MAGAHVEQDRVDVIVAVVIVVGGVWKCVNTFRAFGGT